MSRGFKKFILELFSVFRLGMNADLTSFYHIILKLLYVIKCIQQVFDY